MDMIKDTVIIEASDYEELIKVNAKYEILKNLVINSLELNYDATYIRVNDETIFLALRAVDKDALPKREQELRKEWEEKQKKKEEEANA